MKNQITPAQLQTWAKGIHANAIAKGFYPENPKDRNDKEMLMLIICELAEAVEAHRENRWMDGRQGIIPEELAKYPQEFEANFKAWVKDTVEDEMADALIRILDFTEFCRYKFPDIVIETEPLNFFNEGTFAEHVYHLVEHIAVMGSVEPPQLSEIVEAIIYLCDEYNIDICFHVEAKMKYNATRPIKHGKAY